jgi:uncharacterized membrane protein
MLADRRRRTAGGFVRCGGAGAALVIELASLEATVKALALLVRRNAQPERKTGVRLSLGRWPAVGLEFELAADIPRTSVAPTWNDIGQLAAIAVLRTALTYFLEREIRREPEPQPREARRPFGR